MNLYALVIQDKASRYVTVKLLHSKDPDLILAAYKSRWYAVHGNPKIAYTDGGGEMVALKKWIEEHGGQWQNASVHTQSKPTK